MRLIGLWAIAACGRLGFDDRTVGDAGDSGLPPCTTNVCECNVDTDCSAAHTACTAAAGSHTCDCAAGYTSVAGACTWSGVVADPGFQSTSVWTTSATIDPALVQAGMREPGMVKLTGLQRASQLVTMPRRSRAEPLVLELSSLRLGAKDQPSVGIGKYWLDTTSVPSWAVSRTCLGAAQYASESSSGPGAAMTLQVMPTATATGLEVDHLDLVPAMPNECAPPGPVANGDAEGAGNWTFQAVPANGPDGTTAGFAAGAGDNGTRGAALHITKGCDLARLAFGISPEALEQFPGPALAFWLDGTAGAPIQFIGPLAPGDRVGTGTGAVQTMCLPAPMRGMPQAISAYIAGNLLCMANLVWDATFDEVALVSDPACGSDPDVADPGFESQGLPFGLSSSPPNGTGRIDTTVMHTGAASLRLGANLTCNSQVFWNAAVFPPASSGSAGPALEFYYRMAPIKSFQLAVQATGAPAVLVQDNTWRRGIACFDPQLAGRPQLAKFSLVDAGGTCAVMVSEEVAYIDDLALTTDPSCPP